MLSHTRIHKQQNATVTAATTTLRLTKERVATAAEAEQQSIKKCSQKKEEQKRQRKLDNDYFSISFWDIFFFFCNDALLSFSFLFEEKNNKKNTEAQ